MFRRVIRSVPAIPQRSAEARRLLAKPVKGITAQHSTADKHSMMAKSGTPHANKPLYKPSITITPPSFH